MKIGIAGGIGSGKSYVCRWLNTHYGIEVYDCDAAAKRLMHHSPTLRRQLTQLIGPDTYQPSDLVAADAAATDSPGATAPTVSPTPRLNKARVAQFLLASPDNAHAIDAIVHPAVFSDFEQSGMQWMESALMYESGIYRLVDRVVVVTAPEDVRIARIVSRDNISPDKARQWIARQLPQQQVVARADFEIVNDGVADIGEQTEQLLKQLGIDPHETILKQEKL